MRADWASVRCGAPDGSDDWVHFQYNERWQQMAMYVGTATSPDEVFTYMAAGKDGYGGSSYIDEVVMRERGAERYYYLQNWRHDVVAIMNYDGEVKEKLVYDAYGRPHAFSPGDLKTGGSADRPDGLLDANDTWSTGSVLWNKDIGNGSGVAIPDGTVTSADGTTLTNLKNAGYSAGYGIISDATINNRKGLAGYEFDPVLEGAATADNKPVYHVRHRVLASDTGKWLQKDPLGYHDGMDLYEYCQSDPVVLIDAHGLACAGRLTSSCVATTFRNDPIPEMPRLPSEPAPPFFPPEHRPPDVPIMPGDPGQRPSKPSHEHGNWCGSGIGGVTYDGSTGNYGRQRCGSNDDGWWPGNVPGGKDCPTTSCADACCKAHDICLHNACATFLTECGRICHASMCVCLEECERRNMVRPGQLLNDEGPAIKRMKLAFCWAKPFSPNQNWDISMCDNGRPSYPPIPPTPCQPPMTPEWPDWERLPTYGRNNNTKGTKS